MLIFFPDIASVVGFYAVSLPFFAKNHPMLTGENSGERLSVSNIKAVLHLKTKIIMYFHRVITLMVGCWSNWPRLLDDWS